MTTDDLHSNLEGVIQFLAQEHSQDGGSPHAGLLSFHGKKSENWLDELDPNQREAVTHGYGPMRVMAPAGSGKTRTLVSRVAYLIGQGVPPERILALAFNRKAQQEMQERLTTMGHVVNVRTFHSFGYEIVRRGLGWEYHENSGTRMAELLRKQLGQFLPSEKLEDLDLYFSLLRRATMELVPIRTLFVSTPRGDLPFQPIFEALLAEQIAQRLLTFDGMLYFALRVLLDEAELRHDLQNQFEFVLVDEFQDLNQAQMLLTRMIALPQNNLFVVGDDDQMIYGWRGADVRLILDFPQTFPGAKTVVLGTNYRSARNIVRHSRMLIENNPERVAKDIHPRAGVENGPLDVILANGIRQQGKAALDWMEAQKTAHGLPWEAFAILYRANSHILPVLPLLKARGIPYNLAKETGEGTGEEEEIPEVQPGAATLLTIHKAKGKEFPFVVYLNLTRTGTDDVNNVAEERRVAYVGATRTQKGLLITADEEHFSPFLGELTLRKEFADYALPYLERQAALVRKKGDEITRKLARFSKPVKWRFPWSSRIEPTAFSENIARLEKQKDELAEKLEGLETEIRFRSILNVPTREKV